MVEQCFSGWGASLQPSTMSIAYLCRVKMPIADCRVMPSFMPSKIPMPSTMSSFLDKSTAPGTVIWCNKSELNFGPDEENTLHTTNTHTNTHTMMTKSKLPTRLAY